MELWWGLLTIAHLGSLAAAPSFYNHYAAWAAAPMVLVIAAAIGRLGDSVPRIVRAVLIGTVGVALLTMAASSVRNLDVRVPDRAELRSWTDARRCVWAFPELLVWGDAVSKDLTNRCAFMVDPFGVGLTLESRRAVTGDREIMFGNPRWRELAWLQVQQADGVMLPLAEQRWWFTPDQRRAVESTFTVSRSFGDYGLWVRSR